MYRDDCPYSVKGITGILCLTLVGWLFTIIFTYLGFGFMLTGAWCWWCWKTSLHGVCVSAPSNAHLIQGCFGVLICTSSFPRHTKIFAGHVQLQRWIMVTTVASRWGQGDWRRACCMAPMFAVCDAPVPNPEWGSTVADDDLQHVQFPTSVHYGGVFSICVSMCFQHCTCF